MATQEQLMQGLRRAHEAGDTSAAKRFAELIQESRQPQPQQTEEQRIAEGLQSGEIETAGPLENSSAGFLGVPGNFTREARGMEQRPSRNDLAEQGGVDIETGAPARVRVGASTSSGRGFFSNDPTIRERNVAKLLSESFGQDVPVRTGPVSESLEFQSPETGQWTLVDEAGFTARDIGDFAGDALTLGGETLGAAGGAVAGSAIGPAGTVAGGLGGAAVGAGVGDYSRQKLGQVLFDTNENVSNTAMAGEGAEVAAVTALVGPLLRGAGRFAGNVKTRFTGQTPEREVATLLNDPQAARELRRGLRETVATNRRLAQQEGDDAAADVLARLDDKLAANDYDPRSLSQTEATALWDNSRFQPTLADLSGDADLLADQSRLMQSGPSTSRPLRQQRQEGWSVLRQGLDQSSDVPPQALNKADLSRNIADTIMDRTNRRLAEIAGRTQSQVQGAEARGARQVAQAEGRGDRLVNIARERTEAAGQRVDDLRQPLPENATVDQRALGQDVRSNVLVPEREGRLDAVRSQYDELGVPDAEIEPTALRGAMRTVSQEARQSALPSQESRTRRVASELLRNTQVEDEAGETLVRNLSGEEALATLKSLRGMKREIDRGQLTNADSAVVKRAISALDEDMRAAFPDDYTAAKAVIDDQYRQVQNELERSLIGRMTRQRGGKYEINDEFVFDRLIQSGNQSDAQVFRDMIAKPEYGGQRAALRDAFAERYARQVGKRSDYSKAAYEKRHNDFLRKNGAWMEGTFTPAELADIRKVGNAASKFQRISQRQRQVERNVRDILKSVESGVRSSTRQSVQGIEQRGRQLAQDAEGRARNLVGTTTGDGALNPDAVFDNIWGKPSGMPKLRQLKDALEEAPVLWEQFKARAHNDLGDMVFDAVSPRQGGVQNLDNFLRRNDSYLREAFGDQYVKDLRLVAESLKRTTTQGAGREGNDKGREFLRSFSRVFFAPPLSARGRAQTAVERFIGSNHREEMAKLLADPRNLRRLASMKPIGDVSRDEFIARTLGQGVAAYGGLGYSTSSE